MSIEHDIAALEKALEAGPTPGPWSSSAWEQDRRYSDEEVANCDWSAAAHPDRIRRVLAEFNNAIVAEHQERNARIKAHLKLSRALELLRGGEEELELAQVHNSSAAKGIRAFLKEAQE